MEDKYLIIFKCSSIVGLFNWILSEFMKTLLGFDGRNRSSHRQWSQVCILRSWKRALRQLPYWGKLMTIMPFLVIWFTAGIRCSGRTERTLWQWPLWTPVKVTLKPKCGRWETGVSIVLSYFTMKISLLDQRFLIRNAMTTILWVWKWSDRRWRGAWMRSL